MPTPFAPLAVTAGSAGLQITMRFVGYQALRKVFEKFLVGAEAEQKRGAWWVVSVVDYALILEYGSQKQIATPHWRIAIQSLADDVELNVDDSQSKLIDAIAVGELRKDIAKSLLSRVKRLIIQNDLVDTGNYLASIAMGASQEEAFANSVAGLLDPDTSVVIGII